jgi:hypothetical protein
MSKSRLTEAQIITALKQVEAGRTAEDVTWEQGVSKHTIDAWKAKYGGMDVSEAEEVTRQCLALEVATGFPSRRVITHSSAPFRNHLSL